MGYNYFMESVLLEQLKQHPAFSDLDPDALRFLVESAISRDYPAGSFLAHAGECWPYLFLIEKGYLNAVKESNLGRSLAVAQLETGDLFWGLAFFQEDLPNPVSMQFTKPSRLHLWGRHDILPFLLENGRFTWNLARLMVNRMLHASNVIEDLAFQPVAARLSRLLLENFEREGEPSISRNLTLDEMAARVGTTREMVCRALYRFADRNLIEVTRTEFVLTDKDGLKRVADGP
jgi:CRP/FNR family transcriptional regulator, carbon monoxide oxidation system transcription regulator